MLPDIPIEVDVRAVKSMLDQGDDFLLLDCREPDEVQLVRIAGAVHIPMKQIPANVSQLGPFREKPVVVHCHHGGRSLRVTHWLRQQGFSHAQNMTGGIDAWSQDIDPQLPRY